MRLYITEKPSQVVALQKVIKDPNIKFAPLAGHILRNFKPMEYDASLTFGNWYSNSINGVYPYFPKVFKKKVQEPSTFKMNGKTMTSDYKKKFDDAKKMIDQASEIVIASDPDNEGVVLAMEVIEACGATDKVIGMINMAKLDPISLAQEVKIINKIPYEKMNDAGNTRAIFDWLFGMGLSPIASIYLGRGQTIHMGGVKLPTIRMIVERDLAFENFSEIPFWEIKGLAKDPKTGVEFPITLKYDGEDRFASEEGAKNALKELSNKVKVSDYRESNKTSTPPKPYSLTDLQSEAGRIYKYTAKIAADSAQRLYSNGDQSYPRTEENYYSEGQYAEVENTISHLSKINKFEGIKLRKPFIKRDIFNDKKLEGKAHTSLCPTMQAANFSKMNDIDSNVYMLVATRYFIQFMEDYKYLNIAIKSQDGKFEISATENVEVSKGWKEIIGKNDDEDGSATRTFPKLSKGDDLIIVKTELKKGSTKPKPRFTESSLLKAMERIASIYDEPEVKEHLGENGIGTPATRASIIEDLKKTKNGKQVIEPYIIVDKGKIISTKKARDVIAILPDDITSPVLRAELESMTKSIVYNNAKKSDILKIIEDKIRLFADEIKGISKENGIDITRATSGAISKKMVDYAKKIAESTNQKIDANILEDKEALKAFIEDNKENMVYSFSDKQKDILLKSDDKKILALTKSDSLTKDEFDIGSEFIKSYFANSSKNRTYKLSDKQKQILEKNETSKIIDKLIKEKSEFNDDEWKKIQAALNKIFKGWK